MKNLEVKNISPILFLKMFFWTLVLLLIFGHLDTLPIILWDEARLAVSSYEMYKSGNPILVTYGMSPEMWSVKPPFMLWCQALFIQLIGYNEIAIRLPSAFAALGTVLFLFYFLKRNSSNKLLPFLAVAVLITTPGYVMIHGTRTGDYDAMLVFFNTVYCLSFYDYLKTKNSNYLLIVFLAITLATMTKGVAGLMCTPLLLFAAIRKNIVVDILKTKAFYIGLIFLITSVAAYYLYRESINSGYWKQVVEQELIGRFSGRIQDDKQPLVYYINLMFERHYFLWFPFALIGSFVVIFLKRDNESGFLKYCLLCAIYFLTIISITGTKLEWYEMPAYPFLAVITAYFISEIHSIFKNARLPVRFIGPNFLSISFIILLFSYAFGSVESNVFYAKVPHHDKATYNISYFLKGQLKDLKIAEQTNIINEGYDGHILYFVYAFRERGLSMEIKSKDQLQDGDVVIVHEYEPNKFIRENYKYEEIGSYENVKVMNIYGRK